MEYIRIATENIHVTYHPIGANIGINAWIFSGFYTAGHKYLIAMI